ncbi:MAG TPA: DinB family protein [Bacteroidetes bacterium]|nr:DinB family protein [Bacteroidota bacterium]
MDCKQGTNIIIEQIIEVLEKLTEEQYGRPLPLFNGSSIGQHFRHIYDFYHCLCKAAPDGRIDYADRERDALIETSPVYAARAFHEIGRSCTKLTEEDSVEVLADFSADFNTPRPLIHSTIARELMYAYDHAVHHLAIIKMGLKTGCPDVRIGQQVGVAPSTIKHWKKVGKRGATNSETTR